MIFAAALLDTQSTALTRPPALYLSQSLIAMGTAMFLSSSLLIGFIPVIQDGFRNVVSFLALFSGAQTLGTLLGVAFLGTFLADRQHLHFARLAESLTLADPLVAQRVAQGGAAYASTLVDPLQRSLQGVAALTQRVTRESFVLAYDDLFGLIAALAVVTFVWLTFVAVRNHRLALAAARALHPGPTLSTQTTPAMTSPSKRVLLSVIAITLVAVLAVRWGWSINVMRPSSQDGCSFAATDATREHVGTPFHDRREADVRRDGMRFMWKRW